MYELGGRVRIKENAGYFQGAVGTITFLLGSLICVTMDEPFVKASGEILPRTDGDIQYPGWAFSREEVEPIEENTDED